MQLAKREKYLIGLAVCVIVFAVLIQLVIMPFVDGRQRMQNSVAAQEKNLQKIVRLSQEYKALEQDSETLTERLASRPGNFTLFSFLEKAAGKAGVKNNIKYMKPSASTGKGPFKESLVEMKLEKITLKQMVDYLKLIESPDDIVSVKRISVQTNKKETQYLDAILQVLTFSS
ncbi:MAG: type II secretion system protein M [Proteobacteria bacterium]|nr:type II secretion system protein M [Pseudomonadota bacterium]